MHVNAFMVLLKLIVFIIIKKREIVKTLKRLVSFKRSNNPLDGLWRISKFMRF